MTPELDLSIITTVTTRSHAIKGLVNSILETADPVAIEMCVITEKPENLPATLLGDFPDLSIKTPNNSGAEAANKAINSAAGRYIMQVDHDVIIQPGCLKTLVDFMDDTPDVGVAAPLILDAYGKPENTAYYYPTLLTLLGQTAIGKFVPIRWKKRQAHHIGKSANTPRETDWLGGGVRIIRRELLEDIKLPTINFGRELAETFFCLLARKLGWHIFIIPQAQVQHPNPLRYKPDLAGYSGNQASFTEIMKFMRKRWLS